MTSLLAFESSCDETSVAVVRGGVILASVVSSQAQLHLEYGGVVPELATREHLRNLPLVAREAIQLAGIKMEEVGAVASTQGPGLSSALMTGLKTGQAMAFVLNVPFYGIHHHEAHLYSPWIEGVPPRNNLDSFQPNISLIVSGGHTILVQVDAPLKHRVLGSTIDDAAGECFDKTAKLMGLPYPGGPVMDKLAQKGNPHTIEFPRPLLHDPHHDFSFSGLKTSVRYFLRDHPQLLDSEQTVCDLCASIQAAIVEVLVFKCLRATKQAGLRCITASGGVTCNRKLRSELQTACERRGILLRLADPNLCTDNAAMVAVLAEQKWKAGLEPTDLDAEIRPSWPLP